jgi:hypothetical protein
MDVIFGKDEADSLTSAGPPESLTVEMSKAEVDKAETSV